MIEITAPSETIYFGFRAFALTGKWGRNTSQHIWQQTAAKLLPNKLAYVQIR